MGLEKVKETRERILDAAITLFSARGYHNATTAMIAREADVSQGIIFYYFKSKEELFLTLLKEKSDGVRKEFEKHISGEKCALKKIQIVVSSYICLLHKEEKFYEIVIKQLRGAGVSINKIGKYITRGVFNLIEELIREGITQGIFRKIDTEIAATCLFGMIDFNALRWMMFKKSFPLEEACIEAVDIFLRGIKK